MFTLTKAMQGVFVDPHMVNPANNKSGPSFNDLNRMEDFWQVETRKRMGRLYFRLSVST